MARRKNTFKAVRKAAKKDVLLKRINPRYQLGLSVLVIGLVAMGGYLAVRYSFASSCTLGPKLVPTCGALWGMSTGGASVTSIESEIGRKLDVVHTYHRWTVTFPNATEAAETAPGSGRILLADWNTVSTSGTVMPWTDITNGSQNGVIDTEAQAMKNYGQPMFFTFVHEMDSNMTSTNSNYMGTPAQYKAAYLYLYNRLVDTDHVTNLVWIYDVTGDTAHSSFWTAAYPGAAYVDWIGSDPYNWYTCHNEAWKDFAQTVQPSYNILTSDFPGKPFAVIEYNTPEGSTASMKSDFFTNEASEIQADLPDLHMNIYFDSGSSSNAACDGQIDTSPTSLAGFNAAGLNPFFNPQLTSAPTSTPTPTPRPTPTPTSTAKSTSSPTPTPKPATSLSPSSSPASLPPAGAGGSPPTVSGTVTLAPTNLPADLNNLEYLVDGKPVPSGVINTNTLSNGEHTVEVTATAPSGKTVTQKRVIMVNNHKSLPQRLAADLESHRTAIVVIVTLLLVIGLFWSVNFSLRFDSVARIVGRLTRKR